MHCACQQICFCLVFWSFFISSPVSRSHSFTETGTKLHRFVTVYALNLCSFFSTNSYIYVDMFIYPQVLIKKPICLHKSVALKSHLPATVLKHEAASKQTHLHFFCAPLSSSILTIFHTGHCPRSW